MLSRKKKKKKCLKEQWIKRWLTYYGEALHVIVEYNLASGNQGLTIRVLPLTVTNL